MKAATLAAGLALTLVLPALAETPKVIQQVRHTDAGTQIVIKDYRPALPRAAHAAGPSFKEYDLTAPITAIAPRPAAPQPVVQQQVVNPGQVQMYSQNFAPGPNTGMANNGFWTPGGASILSTGPIWGYGFNGGLWGGGYGGGYGYAGGYGYNRCGGGYSGYGYQPFYLNGNQINQPQQRYNPTPGMHPYSLNPVIPQSYTTPGYGPGTGYAPGYFPGGGGGFRGGGGGGGRCGR